MGRRLDYTRLLAALIDDFHPILNLSRLWLRSKDISYGLRGVRQENIIGIQKNHEVSLTLREARIQRRRLTAIFLQDRFDPIAITVDDRARLIG